MRLVVIVITLSIFISGWFLFKKPKTKSLEKVIAKLHFLFLLLFVVTVALIFQRLHFAGQYTNTFIAVVFLISGIILFGTTTSKIIKVYSGLIAIPAVLTEISLLFGPNPLIFFGLIAYLMFAPPRLKKKINNHYNLEIRRGGFLAPPNLFYLVRSQGILDKHIPLTSSVQFEEVTKFEVISFKENEHVVCNIYTTGRSAFTVDTLKYSE
jgi:hypothetical protein